MSTRTVTTNRLATAAAVAVLLIVIVAFLLPSRPRHSRGAERVICASNLKYIGQAILLYSIDHAGATPDSFVTMLRTGDLDREPDVFTCPSTQTQPASGKDAFADPGPAHCDYVYVGDRLPMRYDVAPLDAILALERETNHDHDGVNVLLGDGHVEFMQFARRGQPTPWWDDVQAQIARGDRPIRFPAPGTRPAN